MAEKCTCSTCWPNYPFFRACGACGNKRCPKAKNHENACTNSNEPGQKGSNYENCGSTTISAFDDSRALVRKAVFTGDLIMPDVVADAWEMAGFFVTREET